MKAIWQIITFTSFMWRWYVLAAGAILLTALLSLATPLLSKEIVDQVVAQVQDGTGDTERIFFLLGLTLALQLVQLFISSGGGWIGDLLEVKLKIYLSSVFYQKVLSLDIAFFDNNDSGKTINRFQRGISQITSFIQSMLNNFLPTIVTAFATLILISFYSWVLALLLAGLFPLYIFISHKSTIDWKEHEDIKNELSDKANSRAYESIAGIRTVKAFARHVMELTHFQSVNNQIESTTKRQSFGWHGYDFARRFLLNGVLFAAYAYIIYHTFDGHYTIGEMTLLLQLVQQVRVPLFAMSFILGQIQRVEAGGKDYFAIVGTQPTIVDAAEAKDITNNLQSRMSDFITFDQVSFGYDPDRPVLSGASFSIKAGQKMALVGESGQGKSTIVNLLLRFYQPQSGSIKVGGQSIMDVTQDSLHEQIAVVFQEAWLFSGSVGDNIGYGNPEATKDDIIEAAKAANAHDFIMDLPDGYDSLVGERGVKLSGGQKQRIAIARAMLKDAPIIVLDEATSALDSKSELLVQQGLDRLLEGRTSIIIAHRLSTIAEADLVAVIAKGQVAEFGSPQQLLKNPNGIYRELVDIQQSLTGKPSATRKKVLRQYDLVS